MKFTIVLLLVIVLQKTNGTSVFYPSINEMNSQPQIVIFGFFVPCFQGREETEEAAVVEVVMAAEEEEVRLAPRESAIQSNLTIPSLALNLLLK